MKSRTSFFNLAIYKKDVTRFAPLWILYTAITMLIMLSVLGMSGRDTNYLTDAVGQSIAPLSILNLFYGIIAAQLLFGELFNSRLCNALHAMPVTREARFGSHVLAGLSFSILPNLLISLLMMPYLKFWWFGALVWVLGLTLQYLCFFGIAVLAMFCTGNRFAATLVYAILNFGSMAAWWFASVIFLPLMPGVVLTGEEFINLSPVVKMCTEGAFFCISINGNSYFFDWGIQFGTLAIFAGTGILLLAAALLLYRRRALECAGDFMAVKLLKPVFLLLYTLCAGVFFALIGSVFGGDTYVAFLIVGLAIGFFTGKMLLERTIRIFHLKSLLQLVVLIAVMCLSLLAVQYDVFGIVSYVPDPDSVRSAQIKTYPYNSILTSDPKELQALENAHRMALQEEPCKHHDRQEYQITYFLKDGRKIVREYHLCMQGQCAMELDKLLSSPAAILGFKEGGWEDYVSGVTGIYVDNLFLNRQIDENDWRQFLSIIYRDCESGRMGSRGGAVTRFSVTIQTGDRWTTLDIRQYSETCAFLQALEKLTIVEMEREILTAMVDGHIIEKEHYRDLLDAMYQDWDMSYGSAFTETSGDTFGLHIDTGYAGGDRTYWVSEYASYTYAYLKGYLHEIGEWDA